MFKNLVGGRPLNGWSLRKILEEQPDYDAAIKAIASVPCVAQLTLKQKRANKRSRAR